MKIAMLSPIAWRTPPGVYGPWEQVTSLLTEELVSLGVDVTLFATGSSITKAGLRSVSQSGYKEGSLLSRKVFECLHISELMEEADKFDLIHNQMGFLPLTYSGNISTPLLTTINGFSSDEIVPVYKKYNGRVSYISISDADRHPDLTYMRTIYSGIKAESFTFEQEPKDYLLFFGRICPGKGTREAIQIAQKSQKKLIIAGMIEDQAYFDEELQPHLNDDTVIFQEAVDTQKRNELLGGAEALLHPVSCARPFELSVLEAMACGTPTIALNKGSMAEIIEDKKNGFLVSSTDEAATALKDIQTIDRAFCRECVEKRFTAKKMAERYLEAYNEIVTREKREDHRPWGFYAVLADEPRHKVKRILVNPGKRLSLQRHQRREEHWYVIEGEGTITIDDKKIVCGPGKSVNIPKKAAHRVENQGAEDLVFIEVQTGTYFGEDDIERIEDDFGRS
ncbi:MAG: glycosyltransferase [Nitrospinota bacterium]